MEWDVKLSCNSSLEMMSHVKLLFTDTTHPHQCSIHNDDDEGVERCKANLTKQSRIYILVNMRTGSPRDVTSSSLANNKKVTQKKSHFQFKKQSITFGTNFPSRELCVSRVENVNFIYSEGVAWEMRGKCVMLSGWAEKGLLRALGESWRGFSALNFICV